MAEALEKAAIEELTDRYPDRPLRTNVEFWSAVVLDFAEVPAHMFTSMFTCARTAGWSAHILEQKKLNKLIRPSAKYVGPGAASGLRRAQRHPARREPGLMQIPADLLPQDGRFGCGPSKVRPEQLAALAGRRRR